jgi:hypothetical protein
MHAIEYRRVALVVTLALGAAAAPASAQLRPSEKFALVQIIDGDTIMITGSRPSQRGRDLYGSPNVPWGKSWTPGADMATVLRVDRDFSINGTAVEGGVLLDLDDPARGRPVDALPRRRPALPHRPPRHRRPAAT